MKVRITNGPVSFWYADKVGQEFDVEDKTKTPYGGYMVKGLEKPNCIDPDDCEVVE